jgi:hypothetical protein
MTKKDAYYFPHDANAQNDEKCLFLISELGMHGYGLYWAFIEAMHETSDGRLKVNLLNGFSIRFNTSKDLLLQFYNTAITLSLFVTDGEYYWSERVIQNKSIFDEKRLKKSKAGTLGMQSRWATNNNVITENNTAITKHNKVKESKVKESNIDISFTTLLDCEKLFLEKTAFNWTEQYAKKEAEKFYNFYSAKGWVIGKNKMKSLTHAIGGWISRQDKPETINAQPKKMTQQEINEQKAREFMSRL